MVRTEVSILVFLLSSIAAAFLSPESVLAERFFLGGDSFGLGAPPSALLIRDFNADGRPDVAVAHTPFHFLAAVAAKTRQATVIITVQFG